MRAMTVSKKHDGNLLASLLWLMLAGCGATLPELKTPLLRGEELVILGTRPGVTVRVLMITPNAVPKGTFLYFPGGDGSLVNTEGRGKWLYTRVFPERGFITAMVDVPSDRPFGMLGGNRFRSSNEHLEDLKTIIDFVYQKWPKPIFLIGHSAGATSAAYLAAILRDDRIGGVVLTSAVGDGCWGPCRFTLFLIPCSLYITGRIRAPNLARNPDLAACSQSGWTGLHLEPQ